MSESLPRAKKPGHRAQSVFPHEMTQVLNKAKEKEGRDEGEILRDAFLEYAATKGYL